MALFRRQLTGQELTMIPMARMMMTQDMALEMNPIMAPYLTARRDLGA